MYKDKNYLPAKDWLPHPIALILTVIKKIKNFRIITNKINFKKLSSYCITSNEGHERSRAENVAKIFNFKHKNFNYEISRVKL